MVPNGTQVDFGLQTGLVAHLFEDVGFNGRFEFAVLENLHFDAQLFECSFVKGVHGAQTLKIEHTCRIQVNLVGHRSQIVGFLGVDGGKTVNKFSGSTEFDKGVADFFQGGVAGHGQTAFHVNALNAFVFTGLFDGRQNLVETRRGHIAGEFGNNLLKWVLRGALGNGPVEVQNQEGIIGHFYFAARGRRQDADEHEESQDKKQGRNHGAQKNRQKIL